LSRLLLTPRRLQIVPKRLQPRPKLAQCIIAITTIMFTIMRLLWVVPGWAAEPARAEENQGRVVEQVPLAVEQPEAEHQPNQHPQRAESSAEEIFSGPNQRGRRSRCPLCVWRLIAADSVEYSSVYQFSQSRMLRLP
jgi:hypothetical protein